jgi:hypothetical protein
VARNAVVRTGMPMRRRIKEHGDPLWLWVFVSSITVFFMVG